MKEKIPPNKIGIPDRFEEPAKPPVKEQPSSFDRTLEQQKNPNLLQKAPQNVQMGLGRQEQNETKVARHREQGQRHKDGKDDDKEQERGKQKGESDRTSARASGQKVIGKGFMKGGKEGQQGQQGKGHHAFGQPVFKRAINKMKKLGVGKQALMGAEASKFASKLAGEKKATHLSKEFIQNLVNQVVKFVKTGVNKEGDKEIRLDLRERIFRGLQLRVSMKGGKVEVHFKASNTTVRDLFQSSSDAIQEELEAKGVTVSRIKVT